MRGNGKSEEKEKKMTNLIGNLEYILERERLLQKEKLTLVWIEGLSIGIIIGAFVMAIVASLVKC